MSLEHNEDNNYINNKDTEYNEIISWDELNIKTPLLRGIYAYGFETPSVLDDFFPVN